ncbi:glycosyltransferase family 39 protein [Phormidium tenue FACHB-886]|nr:glycosyltransferase family 39 protein [Phormidium tenue FACHB-886]
MNRNLLSSGLNWVLILAIALGIGFRFLSLDRKIFWHDEAYTSMRAAGYTRAAIDEELFQNKFFPAPELQKFQNIKPGSTANDTIQSLAAEDPQHPPLYFLMARGWMHLFGGSTFAARMLPALLSLLSLPLMYLLAAELFASRLTALLATALLSLSPFDILFAQTARQYGLLATAIIGSTWFLVRGLRRGGWQSWGLYTLSVAIGLYTHPFFVLTMAAQGLCVVLLCFCGMGDKPHGKLEELPLPEPQGRFFRSERLRWLVSYAGATALSLVLYLPWITVLIGNQQRALATTDWARVVVGIDYLAKLWTLSFTSVFFDLDFGFENPLNFLARVPFVLLIFVAIAVVYRQAARLSWMVTLKTIFVPFFLLALPDLIMGGKRSAVSRYLISSYPGIQLAVAYLFAVGLAGMQQRFWRWLLAIVFAASILSNSVSAAAETWWNKDLSYSNAEVAQLINAEAPNASPVVISDIGDDYTNTGDLISLSFRLKENVRLYLTTQPPNLNTIANEPNVLLFRPSTKIRLALAERGWQMEMVSKPGRLWRLVR